LGGGRTYGWHLARPAYPPNCDVCGRDLQRQPYVDSCRLQCAKSGRSETWERVKSPLRGQSLPALKSPRRPDLRRAHRLRHAVENHHALAAAAGRKRLGRISVAAVDVLPVVHRLDVAGRVDVDIRLHLQSTAHVAAGR
jgi:hypothetical protein